MDQIIGEIRIFAGTIVPEGWAACDGKLLNVAEHETLFSLIGNTFGGDGVRTFAVPNLVGKIPIGYGQRPQGSDFKFAWTNEGTEQVTLTTEQLPVHTHAAKVSTQLATKASLGPNPGETMLAAPSTPQDLLYLKPKSQVPTTVATTTVNMAPGSIGIGGGEGKPHSNLMPTFALGYIIALTGEYPSFQD